MPEPGAKGAADAAAYAPAGTTAAAAAQPGTAADAEASKSKKNRVKKLKAQYLSILELEACAATGQSLNAGQAAKVSEAAWHMRACLSLGNPCKTCSHLLCATPSRWPASLTWLMSLLRLALSCQSRHQLQARQGCFQQAFCLERPGWTTKEITRPAIPALQHSSKRRPGTVPLLAAAWHCVCAVHRQQYAGNTLLSANHVRRAWFAAAGPTSGVPGFDDLTPEDAEAAMYTVLGGSPRRRPAGAISRALAHQLQLQVG